jgi:transmembrane sensor
VRFARPSLSERAESSEEIAAAWALEQQKGLSPRRRAKRDAWLREHLDNPHRLRAAESALGLLDRHAGQPEILALRSAALAARPERQHVQGRVFAATLGGVLVAGLVIWGLYFRSDAPENLAASGEPALAADPRAPTLSRYSTSIGERSTIPLPDGSTVVLNTASTAEVLYTAAERKVRLLQGQALFTVAHGQSAPFRVYAGDRVITALGTVFDVRLEGPRVEVGMLEGTVRVDSRDPERAGSVATGQVVSAGETLVASAAEPIRIRTADVERTASWRSGLLMFDDTPLDVAVAEVNRYTTSSLVLADAAAATYRVTGTFRVGEPERFARTMTELFPLELARSDDGRVVLRRRPAPPDR